MTTTSTTTVATQPAVPAEKPVIDKGVSGQNLLYKTRLGARNHDIIAKMEDTRPGDVQSIVTSQMTLLNSFYDTVLEQARSSFRWAIVAAMAGLGFFLAAVAFMLITANQGLTQASLISGALVEVISGINFYLYGRTSQQLTYFQAQLDRTQRFLLANSICDTLQPDTREKSRADLVTLISNFQPTDSKPAG